MGHWRKQAITFLVASHCNLKCTYCYIPKLGEKISKEDKVINLDFANAGMRDFFSWSKVPAIRFFSAGEPTIEFETMKEIKKSASKMVNKDLSVELQTNGFFSDQIANWIEDHVNILWISCDGPPNLQDTQRPTINNGPSSPVVLKQIKRFSENKKIQFGVRATFTPENFHRQIEVLHYFKELGVKYVCGAPAYNSAVNKKTGIPILVEFAKHFVPAFYEAQRMGVFYQTHLMVNFDEKVKCYCRACSKPICPQLTTDGYVSCCDWASFGPKYLTGSLQQCIYGKWDSRDNKIIYFKNKAEKIENRNIYQLKKGECANCCVLEHCAGGCIGKVMSQSGGLNKTDANWCSAVNYLAKNIPLNQGLYPVRHS